MVLGLRLLVYGWLCVRNACAYRAHCVRTRLFSGAFMAHSGRRHVVTGSGDSSLFLKAFLLVRAGTASMLYGEHV